MINQNAESGNVFWYLFLCIALLSALAFAISQGGRSSVTSLSDDKQDLVATEIVSYADSISKTVSQLRLRGTDITELSFANSFLSAGEYGTYNSDPFTARNEVFNPDGGAMVYVSPTSDATVSGTEEFQFLSENEVNFIGTTCGTDACTDLIMIIDNMRQSICIKINELIGVSNPAGVPPTDSDVHEDAKFQPGAVPFGYTRTIGDEDTALEGQREACFEETGDSEYVYYKVLWPR